MNRPKLAEWHDLQPHPEGGWYRRTWTSSTVQPTARGERAGATAILYLLPGGETSRWHRVASDELWLWHGPGALELSIGDAAPVTLAAEAPQVLVPANVWQRGYAHGDVLVSCVVCPGFDFADFELDGD